MQQELFLQIYYNEVSVFKKTDWWKIIINFFNLEFYKQLEKYNLRSIW